MEDLEQDKENIEDEIAELEGELSKIDPDEPFIDEEGEINDEEPPDLNNPTRDELEERLEIARDNLASIEEGIESYADILDMDHEQRVDDYVEHSYGTFFGKGW